MALALAQQNSRGGGAGEEEGEVFLTPLSSFFDLRKAPA